jgi:hypothetical protein
VVEGPGPASPSVSISSIVPNSGSRALEVFNLRAPPDDDDDSLDLSFDGLNFLVPRSTLPLCPNATSSMTRECRGVGAGDMFVLLTCSGMGSRDASTPSAFPERFPAVGTRSIGATLFGYADFIRLFDVDSLRGGKGTVSFKLKSAQQSTVFRDEPNFGNQIINSIPR